jgi:hypothetical protein
MRLPGKVDDSNDRAHFLTDGYITKFNLDIKKFPNHDDNGISNIYSLKEKTEGMYIYAIRLICSLQDLNFSQYHAKDIDRTLK